MAKKKKIKILELDAWVFNEYRNSTRNNENITYELACKKFTRNMLLAEETFDPYREFSDEKKQGILYKYGACWFIVRDNRVKWMRTKCWYPKGWIKDIYRYNELNKLLGICE